MPTVFKIGRRFDADWPEWVDTDPSTNKTGRGENARVTPGQWQIAEDENGDHLEFASVGDAYQAVWQDIGVEAKAQNIDERPGESHGGRLKFWLGEAQTQTPDTMARFRLGCIHAAERVVWWEIRRFTV